VGFTPLLAVMVLRRPQEADKTSFVRAFLCLIERKIYLNNLILHQL
jgi:hypothetical protein